MEDFDQCDKQSSDVGGGLSGSLALSIQLSKGALNNLSLGNFPVRNSL
jgi:hypothetical protein